MAASSPSAATDQQNARFAQALNALESNRLDDFDRLSAQLRDYPLYHYLRYRYLRPRLKIVTDQEINLFLRDFGNSGYGERLRQKWLLLLAKRGQWRDFLRLYTPQSNTTLRCLHIQARLNTGQQKLAALNEIKDLWLVGRSQPGGCDAIFDYLYNSALMTDELVWQRIALAMDKDNVNLANVLSRRLKAAGSDAWLSRWVAVRNNPARELQDFTDPDSMVARYILIDGIRRLVDDQVETGEAYWQRYQRHYTFSAEQIIDMQTYLAQMALKQESPQASRLLAAMNHNFSGKRLEEDRIRHALRQQDWHAVADFVRELPKAKLQSTRWRYWLARALIKTGNVAAGHQQMVSLAKERDYYGFLAAERMGLPHQVMNLPIQLTTAEESSLVHRHPALQYAQAFYQQNMLSQAQVEWSYITKQLTSKELAQASVLANRWGWYYQAIFTAARAKAWDDLNVRFPVIFREELLAGAKNQSLDPGWVYGIVRQESAFRHQARSHAGALGLMQLMPSTGRAVARKIGLEIENSSDILKVENNIALGTAYLRQMLNLFDGNYMLATAAYNAGPGRAKRWATRYGCIEPDIWMELIPFRETRTYVRRVLFYTRVFEDRLQLPARPLRLAATTQQCEKIMSARR